MQNDPKKGNSLAPVEGALTSYLETMRELTEDPEMPEIVAHEYRPLLDSSDMGPGEWAVVAQDIGTLYQTDYFLLVQCSIVAVECTSLLPYSHSLYQHGFIYHTKM